MTADRSALSITNPIGYKSFISFHFLLHTLNQFINCDGKRAQLRLRIHKWYGYPQMF